MPGGRLVLHVGAMKSGTTFVQSRLFAHRELLRERGVRVPGQKRRSQVLAVQQLVRGGGPMWDRQAAAVSARGNVAPTCGVTRPEASSAASSSSLRPNSAAGTSWNWKPTISIPLTSTRFRGMRGISPDA